MVRPAGLSATRKSVNRVGNCVFAALGARAVELEDVGVQNEAEFLRDFFLQALDLEVFEFDDAVARRARQVIVVVFGGPFVTGGHSAQPNFTYVTLFTQRSQETVNRRETDRWIFRGDRFEHILRGEVIRAAANDFENQEPLVGDLEAEIANDLLPRNFVDPTGRRRESFLAIRNGQNGGRSRWRKRHAHVFITPAPRMQLNANDSHYRRSEVRDMPGFFPWERAFRSGA